MSGSLRTRVTVSVVAIVAIVLAALAVVLYITARGAAWKQHDDALLARARAIAASAEFDEQGYEIGLPPEPTPKTPAYIEVWQPDGTVLARTPSLSGHDLARPQLQSETSIIDHLLPDGRAGRAVGLRFLPRTDPGLTAAPLTLVLADGIDDIDAAVASLRTYFILFALAALVAIAALTAFSLARAMRPLDRLAAELEQIDDKHLAIRLATADQPRELLAVVKKLEQLLARLDASFTRERQFTADVSHELRTPLAGLRTILEVANLVDRSPADYKTAIAEALAIVQQLTSLAQNLLALARAEAGQLTVTTSDIQLRAFVDQCWAPHAERATTRDLTFRNTIPADRSVRTDPDHLRIVVGNLLANAAEYTEAAGWIEVTSTSPAVLDVTDSGPAIPEPQLERIFDRFTRADAARTGNGVHCGIGLSLSRAICARLDLDLNASSSPEGRVSFRVTPLR